jgi:multicomponent Na+:H+ antiporter subunit D
MSKGPNPKALIGAFDYLVLGTIGATMNLIAIGFFLSITGSLNIDIVSDILKESNSYRNIKIIAISFFLIGAILKMAFFPMHFWMIRAYSSVAPIILTYIAAISTVVGVYILMRFVHFTIDSNEVLDILVKILRPFALAIIIICTILALLSHNIKEIVVYSTASSIGYVFLIITFWEFRDLLFQLIIVDGINKIGLFHVLAHIENKTSNLHVNHLKNIHHSTAFKIFAAFVIIYSSGLPFTGMFITKLNIFELFASKRLFPEFIIIVSSSAIAILYHLKITRAIFFAHQGDGAVTIETKQTGLMFVVLSQFIFLFYMNDFLHIIGYTKDLLS